MPKAKKVDDKGAIVGVWKVEKYDGGGARLVPEDKLSGTRFHFSEDGKFAFLSKTPLELLGTFKLDPEAKVKTLDLIYGCQTTPCLYELDGDTMKVCWPYAGTVRPSEFKADAKGSVMVWTLKRVKEEK